MAKKSTRLETLHNIFEENNISPDTIELNDSLIQDIKNHADKVPDYRHPSYTKHLLGDIIMIVFFAVLGNANEWGEIESFAKRKEKWLRKYLELPFGIPTDDTFRVVMGNINTEHFYQAVVTADAINCQKETVAAIVSGKGDYVLALKGNQQLLYGEVRAYFEEGVLEKLKGKEGCYKKTVEPEHGGTAVREYYITEDTGWYSEREKWKKLRSFGMVHKVLKKMDGTKEEEYRYYICSIGEDVDEFERAARGHWGVEVKLHWHLDFTFRDDKNTSMGKTSGKNLQIMKKIALSILGLVKESYKISMKRIRYELSLDFENEIERMLSMLDTDSIRKALESKGESPMT